MFNVQNLYLICEKTLTHMIVDVGIENVLKTVGKQTVLASVHRIMYHSLFCNPLLVTNRSFRPSGLILMKIMRFHFPF
jgi:hypothetical protein